MLNVGIIGAGRIGKVHCESIMRYVKSATVKAIADPFLNDETKEWAKGLGVNEFYTDYHKILEDKDIQAVLICSSTDTHSTISLEAIAAGKHIFCEKPVDLDLARARECEQAVKASGKACLIGFQRRFDPTFNEVRRRIDAGEIGNPEMLVITSRDPGAPPVEYIKGSGGIFRDMLIHDFDVFRWILCGDGDEAEWLSATGSVLTDPAVGEAGDFDSTAVTIRTRQGRLCQINTTRRAAYGYDQRFEVLGAAGMLQAGNHAPSEVRQWDASGIRADKPEAFFLQRYAAAYRLEIEHFFECLQTGAAFRTTVHDGVKAQILADAAAESAASGQPVKL